MFGKKEKCAVCGEKLSGTGIQINGGAICPVCNRLSTGSPLCTAEQLKEAWKENHRRFQSFNAGITVSDFGSGFLFIDTEQKMFYLSNTKKPKLEPVVFKFSEIDEFRIEQVGQKTITKNQRWRWKGRCWWCLIRCYRGSCWGIHRQAGNKASWRNSNPLC